MSPNLVGNTHGLFLAAETMSAGPIQIIGTKYPKQSDAQNQAPIKRTREGEYKLQIVWRNVVIFIILHSIAVYGIGLIITGHFSWKHVLFLYAYTTFAGVGVTGGAHRLWSHRAYKANLPLRIILMLAQSAALQNDIHEWVRDHRVHHKFTDTNADPHNATRGFFFSHVGWLMCRKHKDVITKGQTIDMSDVYNDPVVRFQMKMYIPLIILLTFTLPTWVQCYYFGETLTTALLMSIARYTINLNGTWSVNSAAHIWGMKPYDKNIKPTENRVVSIIAYGEGWHNYHHVFPWDYKAAELGNYRTNITTAFLDFMAKIGWATELKTASQDMIKKRILRTGDGTWYDMDKLNKNGFDHHHHHEDMVWGWGDKDMKNSDVKEVKKFNKIKA